MSNSTRLRARGGPRRTLAAFVPALLLVVPAVAGTGETVVRVPPPNHTDDTANLQAALDRCVASGPGCTVQLAAGTYLTRQLVATNFRGTFKGRGKSQTTIEGLLLPVTACWNVDCEWWPPDTTDHLWPDLLTFLDGDIRVSDLTFSVTHGTASPWRAGGAEYFSLISALRIMGRFPTNAVVERVGFEGRRDDSPWGFNLINGLIYVGEIPKPSHEPFDTYPLSGTLRVASCTFKGSFDGPGVGGGGGVTKDSRVVIGGSPSAGNVVEDAAFGIYFENLEGSVVEASHNRAGGDWGSPMTDTWLATRPSVYRIHQNHFEPEPWASGVTLVDDPANHVISAVVSGNDVGGGMNLYNTNGAVVWDNRLSGEGASAIGISGGTRCLVAGNDVASFSSSGAQIALDQATSSTGVVCARPDDTVQDLGTGNRIIGCTVVP